MYNKFLHFLHEQLADVKPGLQVHSVPSPKEFIGHDSQVEFPDDNLKVPTSHAKEEKSLYVQVTILHGVVHTYTLVTVSFITSRTLTGTS